MKLQIALDYIDLYDALAVLAEVNSYADIVEVGTPLLLSRGAEAIHVIKTAYPRHIVFADAKIMDGGEIEAGMLCDRGADCVSVMGLANDETIEGVLKSSHARGARVLVDMMLVSGLKKRASELIGMGADILCAHTAYDARNVKNSPLEDLIALRGSASGVELAVAGGVNEWNIAEIAKSNPDIIVVGGTVTRSADKAKTANRLRELMEGTQK
ncbi:MAG: orotidine 5'-phosphate decarboxylase [Synergistaceae bacterium]|jgi:3-hexulose-6-phosphate synthase|nr:orotidine 5'-phosphate decarboxylase [Synergistaceae bacterium]